MNSYRLFGPTTVHLEQEVFQLAAMLLLTLSTLQGLNQQDGYWGLLLVLSDLKYLLLVGFWLGRNLLLRWICTSDQSTHKSPSVKGVISHWLASLFVGGQYFDRPHPEVVAKQLGTYHTDDGRNEMVTLKDLLFPSILYTWHAMKVRIVFPFLQAKDVFISSLPQGMRPNTNPPRKVDKKTDSNRGNNDHRSSSSSSNQLKLSRLYTQLRKRWGRYVPPAQILPIVIFVWLVYDLFSLKPPRDDGVHALTMHTTGSTILVEQYNRRFGAYEKYEAPTWALTLLLMSLIGTSATIVLYGRVLLPVGELVEGGGNVLKSIRNEFKPVQHHQTGYGSGKSKSKNQKETPEPVSWPESYVSVANENRFGLLFKSTSIRIIENLVLCALFPRTQLICRFTGHCPEGMSWAELTKVLNPIGIVSAFRPDGLPDSPLTLVDIERGAMVATILSIILITLSSLLTQGATLNRAYLSTMGYLAGGWMILSQSQLAGRGKQLKPLPWDPRKQYKKGDLISQQFPGIGTQKWYMAMTDQPEGRPFDLSLRVVHDTFGNEQCHPANSDLIKFLVRMHLNMIVGLIVMMTCYHVIGIDCKSLRWILLANLAATYGVIRSTRTRGLSEIQNLASEISSSYTGFSEQSSHQSSHHDSDDELSSNSVET